jgi:predicted metalloenzyme YecM
VTGFEHFEVVTGMSCNELRGRFPELFHETKASGNALNPELVWTSKTGLVKFHRQSLERIIETELRAGPGRA